MLERVNLDEMRSAVESDTVILDARLAADYQYDHIPSSLSVPFHLPAEMRRESLQEVARAEPIIIYCQSRSCDYAEQLAALLIGDGFTAIRLFPGGWQEWRDASRQVPGTGPED